VNIREIVIRDHQNKQIYGISLPERPKWPYNYDDKDGKIDFVRMEFSQFEIIELFEELFKKGILRTYVTMGNPSLINRMP
jgi:hypothetical protein